MPHKLPVDKYLVLVLIISFLLCFHGINWGRVEEWNPDQMAFHELFQENSPSFNPEYFLKPPFHTYFNYFLSVLPINIIGRLFHWNQYLTSAILLVWSRILTIFLFLGSIILVYKIIKKEVNISSALVISSIFGTSAGLIAFSHFLTADIPVMFWMLLGFYWSKKIYNSPTYRNYLLAGFFIGIATATKYNGIAGIISLLVFHYLSSIGKPWWRIFFDNKLILSQLMTVVGFILGNPFSILDFSHFKFDISYLLATDKLYPYGDKVANFFSYSANFINLIGEPMFSISVAIVLGTLIYLIINLKHYKDYLTTIIAITLIFGYILLFVGYSNNVPARYLLPIVPYIFICQAIFWQSTLRYSRFYKFVLLGPILIIIYNLICSYYVGKRFITDPRHEAQTWVIENIPTNSIIEKSSHSPDFNLLEKQQYQLTYIHYISSRQHTFVEKITSPTLKAGVSKFEGEDNSSWYTIEGLNARRPSYFIIDSLDYELFYPDNVKQVYPEITQFFKELFLEKLNYIIVFDKSSSIIPEWVYPQNIDFLNNRITIFKRNY